MRILGTLLVTTLLSQTPAQESIGGLFETLTGLSLGIYTGITPQAAELTPFEDSSTPVGSLILAHLGVVLKYQFAFLFVRSGVDAAIPLIGGKGKFSNADFSFSLEQIRVPIVFGLNFPLTQYSSFFAGYGPLFTAGILGVKNHLVENVYFYQAWGALFLLGAEFALTENGSLLVEWQRSMGHTQLLGTASFRERELSLNNDLFLLGYSYRFRF
ncbi:MAG: porin family protein [Leptospiraceae bacterium]|nr:porin family protein [Leptospiraceae bacterium]MDW8306613.1 hypothetical protein [Leptospiraceae bacterium]